MEIIEYYILYVKIKAKIRDYIENGKHDLRIWQ